MGYKLDRDSGACTMLKYVGIPTNKTEENLLNTLSIQLRFYKGQPWNKATVTFRKGNPKVAQQTKSY